MIEHLPMVRFMARRMHERLPQEVSIEDLYSAGVVGLIQALGKFEPSKQVPFRTYAYFWIRDAILDSLRTLDWSPHELRRKGRAIEQAIQKLTALFGRPPAELEIAEELRMGVAAYQQLLSNLKGLEIGTLYTERREDSREEKLAHLPNRPENNPLFRCLNAGMREDVEPVLVCLRLLLVVDARLRKHLGRRGELVTLIVLILNTIDLKTVPVLELGSDMEELLATTVKLPAALHASLKCVASSRQSSMNALMNSAIWAYTEEKSKKD